MTAETITQFILQVGVPSAICLFLIWQSAKREERTNERIADLEKFNREQLVELVETTTEQQAASRNTVTKLVETCSGLIDEMRRRPCQLEQRQT